MGSLHSTAAQSQSPSPSPRRVRSLAERAVAMTTALESFPTLFRAYQQRSCPPSMMSQGGRQFCWTNSPAIVPLDEAVHDFVDALSGVKVRAAALRNLLAYVTFTTLAILETGSATRRQALLDERERTLAPLIPALASLESDALQNQLVSHMDEYTRHLDASLFGATLDDDARDRHLRDAVRSIRAVAEMLTRSRALGM
jgi:hypothetical protein